MKSIKEFAASHPSNLRKCWLCGIPEREQVETAAKDGIPPTTIMRWLQAEAGYSKDQATEGRVRRHLKNHAE